MIATIDTATISNLVIMTGNITLIPSNVKPCGERNEHIDFNIKSGVLEMQVICRDKVGRDVLNMKLKRGDKVSVIGFLENDADTVIVADKVEKVL